MKKFFQGHALVSSLMVLILILSGFGMILFGAHQINAYRIINEYFLYKGICYITGGSLVTALGFVILHWHVFKKEVTS